MAVRGNPAERGGGASSSAPPPQREGREAGKAAGAPPSLGGPPPYPTPHGWSGGAASHAVLGGGAYGGGPPPVVAVGGRGVRPVDTTLAAVALLAVAILGASELCSGPQLSTRLVLGLLWQLAHNLGVAEHYTLLAAWRGWYSLEIGLEISAAIVLGFLVWLIFALLYDTAGILVGLVPATVTSVVTLLFRFHLHSLLLLAVLPAVVLPAVAVARVLDRRWHELEIERLQRRAAKHQALNGHHHPNHHRFSQHDRGSRVPYTDATPAVVGGGGSLRSMRAQRHSAVHSRAHRISPVAQQQQQHSGWGGGGGGSADGWQGQGHTGSNGWWSDSPPSGFGRGPPHAEWHAHAGWRQRSPGWGPAHGTPNPPWHRSEGGPSAPVPSTSVFEGREADRV